jgi:Ras-related protein Rab-1A
MRPAENAQSFTKTVVIGDSGVGKTCVAQRLMSNTFDNGSTATVGAAFWNLTIEKNDRCHRIQMWDTAGQENYQSITNAFYRGADVIVLCYAVNNRNSFTSIERWKSRVDQRVPTARLLLVATKLDQSEEGPEFVSAEEGLQKASELNTPHVATSAFTGEGIDVLKDELIRVAETVQRHQVVVFPESGDGTAQRCC